MNSTGSSIDVTPGPRQGPTTPCYYVLLRGSAVRLCDVTAGLGSHADWGGPIDLTRPWAVTCHRPDLAVGSDRPST